MMKMTASLLAAKLAQAIGMPVGNYWEPGIAKSIQERIDNGSTFEEVEHNFEIALGIKQRTRK